MTEGICPLCGEELYEVNSGIDGLYFDNDTHEGSFIAREFECQNKKCSIYKKKLEVFWDFTRFELDGEDKEF